MGLFVDTTGTNVTIDELGITLAHPTTDYDLSGQFTSEELKNATSLTTAIVGSTLNWKKTSGGAVQPAGDYDSDFTEIEAENLGTGLKDDRAVTFKDLVGVGEIEVQEDDVTISSVVKILNFEGVSVVDDGGGKVTVTVIGAGEGQQAFFFGQGNVGNKWLAVGSSAKTSDQIPYVVVDDGEISAFGWSNSKVVLDVDIEIYINGIGPGDLADAFTVLNKGTIAKSDITPISVSHGDRISVFMRKNGQSTATDPSVGLFIKVLTSTSSEVSTP